jgi:hypothetical protein
MVRDCDHEDIEILYPQNRLLEVKVLSLRYHGAQGLKGGTSMKNK